MTPYQVTLSPHFAVATRVRIVRTADDAVIYDRMHSGGIEHARAVMHEVLDADMGIDTNPPATLAEARQRVSLTKRVSLIKRKART